MVTLLVWLRSRLHTRGRQPFPWVQARVVLRHQWLLAWARVFPPKLLLRCRVRSCRMRRLLILRCPPFDIGDLRLFLRTVVSGVVRASLRGPRPNSSPFGGVIVRPN